MPNITWIDFLKNFGSIIVAFMGVSIAMYTSLITQKNRKNDQERNEIYKKLNDFYSPFQQLRKKSYLLYQIFLVNKSEEFQTLMALLQGEEFTENDKQLLDEIINIDKQLENMIYEKSGLIDKPELRDLLAKAATHFHIISAAYEKRITGEPERFAEYVFPRELDNKISEEITSLKSRLNKINK